MYQDFEDTTQILRYEFKTAPRVLLVDDDALVLEYLKAFIAEAGYEVHTVSSGGAALDSLERDFMPIVIADLNMPGMDGLELCREIRRRDHPGYIYLLLLTVQDSETDILAGLDAGADDYVSKRSSAAQLVARLRTGQRILALEQSLKNAIEERRRMAMTDALTGANNRRYFIRHLGRELKRLRRFGGDLCVLMLDIDHFKQVNDRQGHAVGDQVLIELVQRLNATLPRDYDWCARLGGEEFVVVLPQTDLAGAAIVAEKLRAVVAETPMATTSGPLSVTVSIGVSGLEAMSRETEVTVDMLLEAADRYLYISKEQGRNRVKLDTPFNNDKTTA